MSIFEVLRNIRNSLQSSPLRDVQNQTAQTHLLMGRLASLQVRSSPCLNSLQDAEFQVSSQRGQDGIIDWLIERAEIPAAARSFIEFGVENYRQSNTRFLLRNRNWRGLIMDGDPKLFNVVRKDRLAAAYDLTVRSAFITRETINGLIADTGFRGEIGLLCIDLDGNDYWVWEAIEAVRPILCVCEYNAVFGDRYAVSTPYDPGFLRAKAHFSHLYFGASIAALRTLAARKGYRFVGSTSSGNDAFFVRDDYAARIECALTHVRAMPSLFRESRNAIGRMSYIGGLERLRAIADMPVVLVEKGTTMRLCDLETPYSPEWLDALTGTH